MMPATFSEDEVHQLIYHRGLEALTEEETEVVKALAHSDSDWDEPEFELWRVIKALAEDKI